MEPVIIVHGGAWAIPADQVEQSKEGVKRAALKGYQVLQNNGSAVDAVIAAVTSLEDDPIFDAGHGAALNKKGEVELDAVVIDGKTMNSGAVCGVQDIANPIQLARKVMEETDHCLLLGEGANDFAREVGIPRVSSDELVTSAAKMEWEKYMKYSQTIQGLFSTRENALERHGCDTVGAVVLDKDGNLASGTSTGGITAKRPGRVGDSPIIGSGAYADNDVGAVSTTGHGEAIMKVCLARRVCEQLEKGLSAKDAAKAALDFMAKRVNGAGGIIVINKNGDVAQHFTTERMAWASVEKGNLRYGINHGEIL